LWRRQRLLVRDGFFVGQICMMDIIIQGERYGAFGALL
jgi:hypothetical protein